MMQRILIWLSLVLTVATPALAKETFIARVDDNRYVVDRAWVQRLFAGELAAAPKARIVPALQDGKPVGFKLFAIAPDSDFAAAGLQNGDLVRELNGFTIAEPEKLGELWSRLQPAAALLLAIERRGLPVILEYRFGDPSAVVARPASTASPSGSTLAPDPELTKGIHKINDTHFRLDAGAIDRLLNDPTQLATGARIIPSIQDGKPSGFKLYGIRPGGAYALLGMQNGDILKTINGYSLDSPDKALEAYAQIRSAPHYTVVIERRGTPLTIQYEVKR